jgi:hypothetical protein
VGFDELPRRTGNTDVPARVLRERRVEGGLTPELYAALRRDTAAIAELADHVPARDLPNVKQIVLDRLGFR